MSTATLPDVSTPQRVTATTGPVRPGWYLALSALVLFSVFLLFFRLADRDLWSSHEARAAQNAATILEDGTWGLPRLFDGRLELQKPPLYYWLTALAARAAGGTVDAWAVRLPAALAALGCVLVLAWFGVIVDRPWTGLTAAALLVSCVHFTWLGRTGRIDMPLTLAVTVALLAAYLARRSQRLGTGGATGWLLPGYLAMAAGVLLKGPIAVVLPAAVVAVHRLAEGELPPPWHVRRWLKLTGELGLWWGLPLVLLTAGPWFLWADRATDGELGRVFFWYHNVARGFGGTDGLRARPWWFYLAHLAGDLLPWSLLLPVAGWWFLRRGLGRDDPEARFGLVWLLTLLGLLSLLRFKRADYLLPAYPGAILFLTAVLSARLRTSSRPGRWRAALGTTLTLIAVGWAGYLLVWLPREEAGREMKSLAAEVRRRAPLPERVVFFRTENHALAFHVGRPLEILVQWPELDRRLDGPDAVWVVMPPDSVAEWSHHLRSVRLEEVADNVATAGGFHEEPLVLLRSRPAHP